MATRTQVLCAEQKDGRITDIGGINPDKKRWKVSAAWAIENIENGTFEFYVEVGGKSDDVIVAGSGSNKYLRTKGDNTTDNNLLKLSKCP